MIVVMVQMLTNEFETFSAAFFIKSSSKLKLKGYDAFFYSETFFSKFEHFGPLFFVDENFSLLH